MITDGKNEDESLPNHPMDDGRVRKNFAFYLSAPSRQDRRGLHQSILEFLTQILLTDPAEQREVHRAKYVPKELKGEYALELVAVPDYLYDEQDKKLAFWPSMSVLPRPNKHAPHANQVRLAYLEQRDPVKFVPARVDVWKEWVSKMMTKEQESEGKDVYIALRLVKKEISEEKVDHGDDEAPPAYT